MSLHVAAYDVSADARRTQVARVLADYGRRVQNSVFEVWLTPRQLRALRRRVGPLLGPRDRFHIFPVDERGPRRRVAWQTPPNPYGPVIVVPPRSERDGPVPGCRVFHVDDIPEQKPWNWLYRHVNYLKGEPLAPEDDPWTRADPNETWIGAVSGCETTEPADAPEVRGADRPPGDPGKGPAS